MSRSDSASALRLALLGHTPFGRGKVKLEWEVKPLGTAFGVGLQQSAAWMDTGTAGVALDELVGNLSASTAYHWRVRLRYHPATTPFQQYSRWITQTLMATRAIHRYICLAAHGQGHRAYRLVWQ